MRITVAVSLVFTLLSNIAQARSIPARSIPPLALLNIRIEGLNKTIYEGPVLTAGHNVTTLSSNGTHHCDGTNYNINPTPGPTATSALDDAARLHGFTWDGTDWVEYDDIFITRIGSSEQNPDTYQYWGILLAYQYTPVGGCQQRVANGDDLLFAFDAFNKSFFLKASGPSVAHVGAPVQVSVIDGTSGVPITGAEIGGVLTDENGTANITFAKPGVQRLKAERSDSIRSNSVIIAVLP